MANLNEQHKSDIIDDYSGLGQDESRSGQVCPACEGGSSKEKSFSVTRRDGLLLFSCHRSSCGASGVIELLTGAFGETRKAPSLRSRAYIPLSPLDPATFTFLSTKFGVLRETLESAGIQWTGEGTGYIGRRVCFPIFGPDLRERGASYRSYEGKDPKALIYWRESATAGLSWYKLRRASKVLILVEDQMSAIKLSPYFHSAALLGVSLNDNKVAEIKENDPPYERVYICLDNDATNEAIKLQLRWRNKLPNLNVVGLQKDIKDMDKDELEEYLKRIS